MTVSLKTAGAPEGEERRLALSDITERKRSEAALLESRRFFESTFDALTAHIAILDEQGMIIQVNAAWHRFAQENGFQGSSGLGDNYLQICHAAGGECSAIALEAARGIAEVMTGKRSEFVCEYPCHGPTQKRWFIARVTRFAGEGPVRVVVAHENITERKRAEEKLQQSEDLRSRAEALGKVGGWKIDLTTRQLTWTKMVYEIHELEPGFQPTVEQGINFYTPESRPIIQRAVQRAIELAESFDLELDIITAKGNRRQVHAIGHADLVRHKVFGFFQDITEHRRSQEALRVSERLLNEAQAMAKMGSWQLEFGAENVRWSGSAELHQIYGYPPDQTLTTQSGFDRMPPDERERVGKIWEAFLRGEIPGKWEHCIIVEGQTKWLQVTAQTHFDPAGRLDRVTGTLMDITERKLAEIYNEMDREVLQILNEPGELKSLIQRVVATLKLRSGFDAIGIRMAAGDDFPYFVQEGFSEDFLRTESTLAGRTADGDLCRDEDGKVRLECACGLVLEGRTDSTHPCFTPGGSFWTNDSSALLRLDPGGDARLHPRNKCSLHGYASVALVPLRSRDRSLGLIQFADRRKGCFALQSVERLEEIAAHLSLGLLRHQAEAQLRASREELRALTARVQAAREAERTHLAREIHDVLAQDITGLKMELAWLGRQLAGPLKASQRKSLQTKVAALMHLTDQFSQSVQQIATDLRPVVLDSLGVCAATEWIAADFQKRAKICCTAHVPEQELPLDRDQSTGLFRILQESLTNIVRHAKATQVEIHLRQEAGKVILSVRDNGLGFQPDDLADTQSLGLLGMRERATLLGGSCTVESNEGSGTSVEVRLPVDTNLHPVISHA